jgi:hypothetical protein
MVDSKDSMMAEMKATLMVVMKEMMSEYRLVVPTVVTMVEMMVEM